MLMKHINARLGRRGGFVLGCILCLGAFVLFFFLTSTNSWLVYIGVVLLGVGNSTIMVCAQSMESDLVDCHVESGAFVFGSLSFTDKLSNGIVIFLIQNRAVVGGEDVRLSMSIYPGLAALCGMLMTLFLDLKTHPHSVVHVAAAE